MHLDGFDDVLVHALNRVEGGYRILEDHAVPAAEITQLVIVKGHHIHHLRTYILLAVMTAGGGIIRMQSFAHGAFPTAALAHHSEDLAPCDIEAHMIDRADRSQAGVVGHGQFADLDQWTIVVFS